MSTVLLLLITALMLTTLLALWGILAMASWSDRQIARAWEEWRVTEDNTGASRE